MTNIKRAGVPAYLSCAAFLVEDNIITHINQTAAECNIRVGDDVREMICAGMREYEAFKSGKLYLDLRINGTQRAAGVSEENGRLLFCLLTEYDNAELKAMALAGHHLIQPLQDSLQHARLIRYRADKIDDPDVEKICTEGLSQSLFRLMRSINNMVDASIFSTQRANLFSYEDLTEIYDAMGRRLQRMASTLKRRIRYTGLHIPVYTMLDRQALERAFYNMISNAVKFSPEGSTISIKLAIAQKRVLITVTNNCLDDGIPMVQYFDRYLRHPAPEPLNYGIGLGTTVIRTIATAHKGTLFIHSDQEQQVSVTMSVGIAENTENIVRSLGFRAIYGGGDDTALVELSEVLPAAMYENL